MIRKRYLIFTFALLVLLTFALQTPAAEGIDEVNRPSTREMDALTGSEPHLTIAEKVLEAVSEDSVVVRSVDGRTVIMMEGEPEDEFSISFSDVIDGVAANIKLGKGGLQHRFTLVKPADSSNNSPIYLDLVGPAVNGGAGVKITIRF